MGPESGRAGERYLDHPHDRQDDDDYEFTTPNGSSTHLLANYDDPDDTIASQREPSEHSPRWQGVPRPIARVYQVTKIWVDGPQPPQIQRIDPFCARTQTAPIRLLDHYVPKRKHRCLLLLAYYLCWFLAFVAVLHRSANSGRIEGYHTPRQIGCVASYW